MHGIVFCDCIFRDVRLRFEYKVARPSGALVSRAAACAAAVSRRPYQIDTVLLAAAPDCTVTIRYYRAQSR